MLLDSIVLNRNQKKAKDNDVVSLVQDVRTRSKYVQSPYLWTRFSGFGFASTQLFPLRRTSLPWYSTTAVVVLACLALPSSVVRNTVRSADDEEVERVC